MATFAKRVLQIEEQESQAKELSEDATPQTTRRSSTAALSSASAAMARIELAIANLKSPTKASSNHNIQSTTPTPLLTPFKSSPPPSSSTSPIDSPDYQETTKWKRMVVGQIAGLEISCESLQLQNTQLIIHNKLLEKKLQQSQRDNRALREAMGEKISAPNPIQDASIAVKPNQNTSTTPTLQQPPAPVSPPPLPIVTEEEKKFQAEYLARQQQMFSSSSPIEESRIIQTTMEFNAVQTQLKHLKQVLSIAKMDNFLQGKIKSKI